MDDDSLSVGDILRHRDGGPMLRVVAVSGGDGRQLVTLEEAGEGEILPGDVVRLRSGGPSMTVTRVSDETEQVTVVIAPRCDNKPDEYAGKLHNHQLPCDAVELVRAR